MFMRSALMMAAQKKPTTIEMMNATKPIRYSIYLPPEGHDCEQRIYIAEDGKETEFPEHSNQHNNNRDIANADADE